MATAQEILAWLANTGWQSAHDGAACPPEYVPTPADIASFEVDGDTWRVARDTLNTLQLAVSDLRHNPVAEIHDALLAGFPLPRNADDYEALASPGFARLLELAWQAWRFVRPTHPDVQFFYAPIVAVWQEAKAPGIDLDRKRHGILPAAFRTARQAQSALFDSLPERLDRVTPLGALRGEAAEAFLPGLEPAPGRIIPVLPVAIYDAAGGPRQDVGRGAPIAQRLCFELMMAARRTDRKYLKARLQHVTLGDLVAWIWPNGWDRSRALPRLRRALIELDNMRITWERFDRRLIAVDDLPRYDAKLTDRVPLRLAFLPESDHGPLIDRPQLRLFGLQSAPAWRSYLRLAYLWDDAKAKNGGHRIYATRPAVKRGRHGVLLDAQGNPILKRGGQPVKDWSDPRAVRLYDANGKPLVERNPQADRVPVLDLDDLARLGFDDDDVDGSVQRWRRKRTRHELNKMAEAGVVVLEKDGDGWRVLEPAPPEHVNQSR